MKPWTIILCYLAAVSLISVILCVYDKIAAKRNPRGRVREATLLLWSALGGSLAMYATMILIRHKTQHKKFMIGIPLIMIAQLVLVIVLFMLHKNGAV